MTNPAQPVTPGSPAPSVTPPPSVPQLQVPPAPASAAPATPAPQPAPFTGSRGGSTQSWSQAAGPQVWAKPMPALQIPNYPAPDPNARLDNLPGTSAVPTSAASAPSWMSSKGQNEYLQAHQALDRATNAHQKLMQETDQAGVARALKNEERAMEGQKFYQGIADHTRDFNQSLDKLPQEKVQRDRVGAGQFQNQMEGYAKSYGREAYDAATSRHQWEGMQNYRPQVYSDPTIPQGMTDDQIGKEVPGYWRPENRFQGDNTPIHTEYNFTPRYHYQAEPSRITPMPSPALAKTGQDSFQEADEMARRNGTQDATQTSMAPANQIQTNQNRPPANLAKIETEHSGTKDPTVTTPTQKMASALLRKFAAEQLYNSMNDFQAGKAVAPQQWNANTAQPFVPAGKGMTPVTTPAASQAKAPAAPATAKRAEDVTDRRISHEMEEAERAKQQARQTIQANAQEIQAEKRHPDALTGHRIDAQLDEDQEALRRYHQDAADVQAEIQKVAADGYLTSGAKSLDDAASTAADYYGAAAQDWFGGKKGPISRRELFEAQERVGKADVPAAHEPKLPPAPHKASMKDLSAADKANLAADEQELMKPVLPPPKPASTMDKIRDFGAKPLYEGAPGWLSNQNAALGAAGAIGAGVLLYHLLKRNKKTAAQRLKANDLVDMESGGGMLSDYLEQGAGFSGERAGRSAAMSKAIGKTPDFFVENPMTSSLLTGALGAGVGAALGGGLAGAGHGTASAAMSGTTAGWMAGGVAGALLAALIRRKMMSKTNEQFDAAKKIHPVGSDRPGFLRGLVTPLSGPHHKGEARAVEAMQTGDISKADPSIPGSIAAHIPGVNVAAGWAQNMSLPAHAKAEKG